MKHRIVTGQYTHEVKKEADRLGKNNWKGVSITFHPSTKQMYMLLVKEDNENLTIS